MNPTHKTLKVPAKATLGFRLSGSRNQGVDHDLLVVIFLRGGADGLSLLAPYADDSYYRNRSLTAIDSPSSKSNNRLIDLDGFFGLHPSLSPLYPFYESKELAFIHACGSGDITLSHFAASNTVERGQYREQGDSTGWLARYLDALPANDNSAIKAVSIGSLLPASLAGASCAMAIQNVTDLLINNPFRSSDAIMSSTLRSMYSGNDLASAAGRQTLGLIDLLSNMPSDIPSHHHMSKPIGLAENLRQVAHLYRSGAGLAVACLDHTGYDTHVVQGASIGILASSLSELAVAISSFVQDLGAANWQRTKVLVMSEFGRRVRENDGGGTDHGHGGVMMALGGAGISGGKVHVKWPGISDNEIDENGNLRVTTDYRNVLMETLSHKIGVGASKTIFPDLDYLPVGVVNG